jgi:hypothetical protein
MTELGNYMMQYLSRVTSPTDLTGNYKMGARDSNPFLRRPVRVNP